MEVRLEAPAGAVSLLSDLHDWKRNPLPVAEVAPFDLPDDARLEYAWLDIDGEMLEVGTDEPADNPWWPRARAVSGPRFRIHADVPPAAARAAQRLTVLRLASRFLDDPSGSRRLFLYTPAPDVVGARPVVYFQDGKAFWHWGRVGPLVDDLTDRGELPPAHYVFVQPSERTREYVFRDDFRRFMTQEVLPAVEERLPCDDRRVLWGASLGALACADLALAEPGVFDTVIAQSGAFLIAPQDDPPDPFAGSEWLLSRFRAGAGADVRWMLECGTLEWLIGAHRRLEGALAALGTEHRTLDRNMGHNWANWRQGLPDGLRFALA